MTAYTCQPRASHPALGSGCNFPCLAPQPFSHHRSIKAAPNPFNYTSFTRLFPHRHSPGSRVGSESLFEAVAQLTGLRELRMAVYSNADHCIPCHLSHLSALAALQRFQIEKRRAYFPEVRPDTTAAPAPAWAFVLPFLASQTRGPNCQHCNAVPVPHDSGGSPCALRACCGSL